MICYLCSKQESVGFQASFNFQISQCQECDREVCSDCAEVDYDCVGDPPHYVCCQWQCAKGCT